MNRLQSKLAILTVGLLLAACETADVGNMLDGGKADAKTSPDAKASDSPIKTMDFILVPSCPADLAAAIGKTCTVESKSCGTCSDPCAFCNVIRCQQGKWVRFEVPPMPCSDAGVGDGGAVSFKCGASKTCAIGTQRCDSRGQGMCGGPPVPDAGTCGPNCSATTCGSSSAPVCMCTTYSCVALPTACNDCKCLGLPSYCVCKKDADGSIHTSCPAP